MAAESIFGWEIHIGNSVRKGKDDMQITVFIDAVQGINVRERLSQVANRLSPR